MEYFDIIGAIKDYAEHVGMKFIYSFDSLYSNELLNNEDFCQNEHVLIADFKATPQEAAGKIVSITYNCLIMLGRKVDYEMTRADLDETPIEKYDRRIKEMMTLLTSTLISIACINELTVDIGEIIFEQNVFDSNIDFCTATNVEFSQ